MKLGFRLFYLYGEHEITVRTSVTIPSENTDEADELDYL